MRIEQKRIEAGRLYPGIDLQWKVVNAEQGIIQGYLSVFNNVDSTKDRVRPGAYKKTIADALQRKDKRGKKFLWPLLWMHDPEKPIGGFIDAEEDKYGLLVTAQLDVSTLPDGTPRNPLAMSIFSGFDMGYIDELSIGYKALQKAYDSQGIRDLTEIQLFEGSAVTMNFAANDLAQVSNVKAHNKMPTNNLQVKDFNDRYREQVIEDWMYTDFSNLVQALKGAIMDMFMIGDEPQLDVLTTILNTSGDNKIGFIAALEAYVQKGIDLDVANYLSEQTSSPYGYMRRAETVDSKSGAVVSQDNAARLKSHVDTLMQAKNMLHTVAEDITHYITNGPAYANDKTTPIQPSTKTLEADVQPSSDTYAEDESLQELARYLATWKAGKKPPSL